MMARPRFCHLPLFACALLTGAMLLLAGCRNDDKDSIADPVQLTANNFAVDWRAEAPVGDGEVRRLYVNEDKVIAVNSDNRAFFLNRKSGHINQITQVGQIQDTVFEPLTLPTQIVFPSTNNLTVVNRDGVKQFQIRMRYAVASGVVGNEDRLFLGLDSPNGGRVVAVANREQPYDVTPLWELLTRGQASSTPGYHAGQVYAGSRDGNVYAVLGETRETLWPGLEGARFQTGGPILADVKADKDGVYVASMDSKLYCLDLNTGRVKWRYYAGPALREDSSPVVTANNVYLFVPGQGVVAIDKNNRNEIRPAKWAVGNARRYLAQDDQYAYLQMNDNRIAAVDRQTGQPRFASTRRDFTTFALNPIDSTIYAATRNGTIYAIRPVLKPGGMGELVTAE